MRWHALGARGMVHHHVFRSASDIGRGERWASANQGHPLHAEVISAVDARRTGYYGGYRGTPGLAHLVRGA